MTLFRQISILFTTIFILILAALFSVGFRESQKYIEREIFAETQNSAAILSISMSQAGGDMGKMKVIAEALFDTGLYREIVLRDPRGKVLFEKRRDETANVPGWFKKAVNIESGKAVANVTNGWQRIGVLEITPGTSVSIEYLYHLSGTILLIFIIASILGLSLLYYMLNLMLRPLEEIEEQAKGVLDNRFVLLKNIPAIEELRGLRLTINTLILRAREMSGRLADLASINRQLEYSDELTGAGNRRFFSVKYSEYTSSGDDRAGGSILIVRLNGIEKANRLIGYDNTDMYYKKMAETLEKTSSDLHNTVICRISGTEFAVLFPEVDSSDAEIMAHSAISMFREMSAGMENIADILYVSTSIISYDASLSLERALSMADLDLNKLSRLGRDSVKISRLNRRLPLNKSGWRSLIEESLKSRTMIPVIDKKICGRSDLAISGVSFDIPDSESSEHKISYGIYSSVLIDLDLFDEYLAYLLDFINDCKTCDNGLYSFEVFIGYLDSVYNINRLIYLAKALRRSGRKLLVNLQQDELARSDIGMIKSVSDTLKENGIHIGISKFDASGEILELIQEITPSYIEISAAQFLDMSEVLRRSLLLLLESTGSRMIISGDVSNEDVVKIRKLCEPCCIGRGVNR